MPPGEHADNYEPNQPNRETNTSQTDKGRIWLAFIGRFPIQAARYPSNEYCDSEHTDQEGKNHLKLPHLTRLFDGLNLLPCNNRLRKGDIRRPRRRWRSDLGWFGGFLLKSFPTLSTNHVIVVEPRCFELADSPTAVLTSLFWRSHILALPRNAGNFTRVAGRYQPKRKRCSAPGAVLCFAKHRHPRAWGAKL